MTVENISFLSPHAAYLIFVAFLFLWLFGTLFFYRRKMLHVFLGQEKRHELLLPRSRRNFWWQVGLMCFSWVFATFALMQPAREERVVPLEGEKKIEITETILQKKPHEVAFFLDASASMSLQDTLAHLSRFEYAKEIVEGILEGLSGESVSLYAFTSEVVPIVPPTMDYLFFRLMLKQVEVREGGGSGTDFKTLLQFIQEHYLKGPKDKLRTIVVLSDGGDSYFDTLSEKERREREEDMSRFLQNASEHHLRMYCIGMGSKEGAEIPRVSFEGKSIHSAVREPFLMKLSREGRGSYHFANAYTSFSLAEQVLKALEQQEILSTRERTREISDPLEEKKYRPLYQIPLGIAIVLLAFALLIPPRRF